MFDCFVCAARLSSLPFECSKLLYVNALWLEVFQFCPVDPCCVGETLLRKLGRADMIKKQSVPEIVFAYFHNK